jgi:hypothetical protein
MFRNRTCSRRIGANRLLFATAASALATTAQAKAADAPLVRVHYRNATLKVTDVGGLFEGPDQTVTLNCHSPTDSWTPRTGKSPGTSTNMSTRSA